MNHDSGKQPFLRAIEADRYDKAVRLAYADWLEERGYDDEAVLQRAWTVERQEAEDWLRWFADECGYHDGYEGERKITYEEVIEFGRVYQETGDGWTQFGSTDAQDTMCHHRKEFWKHWQTITGVVVPEDKKDAFFSCSC